MQCSSCAHPLPEGARFCPSCGQSVAVVADEERKVVTVLFADVVGFTAWAEHLDPERVKRMIDRTLERLVAAVKEFGGTIDKVLGDGVLALFGVPAAHEDDPTRALRAAIRMHASIVELNEGPSALPAPIELRVGVNTGEVLVGTVLGTDDYTAMGDVVNVAARLQGLAPPGGVYVGDTTARLASHDLKLEVVDDVEVRGRTKSELVWTLIGRRSSPLGRLTRDRRRYVGRETQRALLNSLLDTVAAGRSAVVAVTGEAGSGKTRFVNEVLGSRDPREFSLFEGVCAPFGENTAWTPIASALFRRLGGDEEVDLATLRTRIRERSIALYRFDADDPGLDRWIEGAMRLLGYPSDFDRLAPADAREHLFGLVIEGVRRRSFDRPVVVWIDDLQWADPLMIDLLHWVTRSVADRPVLIITAQRDDVELDWPPGNELPLTVRMPLDALEEADAQELIISVLGDSAPAEVVRQIYTRGGGNPLFLIQLAEMARDMPASTELPGSLRALIAARIDRLRSGPRAVLDNAAVLGSSGPRASLVEFAAHLGQDFDDQDLETLDESGLLDIEETWWRFRSDVVREVVYQTLTKTARAQRHAGTAAVMLANRRGGIDQAAHHAATAAELVEEIGPVPGVVPSIREQAIGLLLEAVQRSLDLGAFANARRLATRALSLRPTDRAVERRFLLVRAEACLSRRELAAARADAQRALEDALSSDDRCDQAIALRFLGLIAQAEGDVSLARAELARSIELLRALGNERELGTSLSDAGFVELFGGSLDRADLLLAESEALFTRLADPRRRAWASQHRAWAAFLRGDVPEAWSRSNETMQLFEEMGDQQGISWGLALQAYLHFMERDFEPAMDLATRVRALALEDGQTWAPAMMDSLLAGIRLWKGDFAGASELSRRAVTTFREIGDRFALLFALAPRLRALVALGHAAEARAVMEETIALSDGFGDLAYPAMAVAGAAAHLGLGEYGVAFGEQAVERAAQMGADDSEARITLALLLCQAGRAEHALTQLLSVKAPTPYSEAVCALASVLVEDRAGAVSSADAVLERTGASYLDRVLAQLAAGVALFKCGDLDAAAERLADARETAMSVGDSVAYSLVANVEATTIGPSLHPSAIDLAAGWRDLVRALT